MKILALDFSSPQRSAAVLIDDSSRVLEANNASPGREMKPFALIESVLHSTGLEREAIECIAVGIGPGSYSGIRVALAIAQGWQLATGTKLLGIGSAESIAAQAAATGISGKFSVVIDAQRGEFYLASYKVGAGQAREISQLRLATREEVQARAAVGELLVGPEVQRWFPGGKIVFPQASTLAQLAVSRTDFLPGEKLEPIYLRETSFLKAPPPRVLPG